MNVKWKTSALMDDIPLRYKFLIILLGVLIPIISINTLFYLQTSKNAETREAENLQISVERAGYDFMQMVNECVAIGNTVAADRTLNEMLDYNYADYDEYYENYDNVLRDRLRQYSNLHSYILWLGVYTTNPTIQSGNSYFVLQDSDKNSEWYQKIAGSKEKVLLTSYLDTNPMYPNQKKVYISIIRKMDNYPGLLKHTKYLRIDLRLDSLKELFAKERDYMTLKLIDDKNRIVLASDQSHDDAGDSQLLSLPVESGASGDGAIKDIIRPLGPANYTQGWNLVGTPERKDISGELRHILRFILILALITTLIPAILFVVILRSYNLRVKQLYKHMKLVNYERFETIHMYEGKDEIGGLLRSFNMMTEKIRNLINDVYKLEIQKKDLELERVRAELNYLQSQVDPHFLFNTLNAVLVICKKYKYEQVTDIIRNLAQILRRLLSWKDDLVTIEEEVMFIEMYLQIEKFRFQDRFSYELDVDPGLMKYRIPKMSIQALVENSCKHGLQSVKGARLIRIGIHRSYENLIITVEDNGIGMNKDKLDWINRNLHSDDDTGKNIGLRNVYKRLKVYYDGQAKLVIESDPYVRTAIVIQIPLNQVQAQAGGEIHV
ncbi:sensor histidine kinase [Paenibacillus sp. S28]|uniref:sensor histidine kinase n=1 Tax=Paenibacillus sp. S28 TaxID=2767463 RepID=UPI00190CEB0D|nr:sensor histidine kinase [Paenibacillus sp. S28]MBJ9989174.1 sensor histidine kinase [Paenibacillus sp. S28]